MRCGPLAAAQEPDGRLLPAHRQRRGRAREEHRRGAPGVVRPRAHGPGRAVARGHAGAQRIGHYPRAAVARGGDPQGRDRSGAPLAHRSAAARSAARTSGASGPAAAAAQPSVEAVEMRPAPLQIRVSPPGRPMASEPVHAEDAGIGMQTSASSRRRKCRSRPRSGRAGRRVAAGRRFPTAASRDFATWSRTAKRSPAPTAPPPRTFVRRGRSRDGAASGLGVRAAEPRLEAEPVRPVARRPTPRDAERALVRPPAAEPGRVREAREPRRPRDAEAPRPSSRRPEPPPPPPFLDAPGDKSAPAAPVPDIDEFETRAPSSMVRQEDLRRPVAPRPPQPEKKRREARREAPFEPAGAASGKPRRQAGRPLGGEAAGEEEIAVCDTAAAPDRHMVGCWCSSRSGRSGS